MRTVSAHSGNEPSRAGPGLWSGRRTPPSGRRLLLMAFPGAEGGRLLPCSPAGAARNRLGFQSVYVGFLVLPTQLRPA